MNGKVALSTAGRDAGELYIIVGSTSKQYLLADGIKRKIANPKAKNIKHVSVLEGEPDVRMLQGIAKQQRGCDEMIRQMLHHKKKNGEYVCQKLM